MKRDKIITIVLSLYLSIVILSILDFLIFKQHVGAYYIIIVFAFFKTLAGAAIMLTTIILLGLIIRRRVKKRPCGAINLILLSILPLLIVHIGFTCYLLTFMSSMSANGGGIDIVYDSPFTLLQWHYYLQPQHIDNVTRLVAIKSKELQFFNPYFLFSLLGTISSLAVLMLNKFKPRSQ